MSDYDVIVIGTGVSGQTAAEELAAAGKRVAVVDRREYGGTCLLRGCEAKKVLFTAAEAVERVRAQAGHGPRGAVRLDWPELIAFKREFTDPVPANIEKWFAEMGATRIHGEARFVDHDRLSIAGTVYTAEHFVIATGARPAPLGIGGEELVMTSEDFMAREKLGDRIVFIGGGYISFEFAHIAHAAGAEVTICHRSSQALKGFDPDLVHMLIEGYRQAGIRVRLQAPVRAVERDGRSLIVLLDSGERLPCDMVVHGAGRVPQLEDLDLEAGGVQAGPRGIAVDDHQRSISNRRVWAAGDAAARGLPLTPVGILQARVIVRNILSEETAVYDPSITPSVVFSDPPLAMIGLTESQAQDRGIAVRSQLIDASTWAASRRVGMRVAGSRILVEEGTERILGAHLLGHHADELINVFALAMLGSHTVADLRSLPWAYPTAGWDIVYMV